MWGPVRGNSIGRIDGEEIHLGSLETKRGKQQAVAARRGGAEQVGMVATQSSHSSSSSSSPAWSSPSSGGRQKKWNSGWAGGFKSPGGRGFLGPGRSGLRALGGWGLLLGNQIWDRCVGWGWGLLRGGRVRVSVWDKIGIIIGVQLLVGVEVNIYCKNCVVS